MTKKNNHISEKIALIVGWVEETFAQFISIIKRKPNLWKDFVGFHYRSTQPKFLGVSFQ